MKHPTLWLFGLPNSGKTTLAKALSTRMDAAKIRHEYLDGDQVRAFFGNDLGYSPEDRRRNIRRIVFAVSLLAKHGVPVIVANILPFEDLRRELKEKVPQARIVYLKASLETCRTRDASKRALEGGSGTFGKDLGFEEPSAPDLVLDTGSESVDACLEKLSAYVGLGGES